MGAKADPKTILLVEDREDDVLLFKRALKKAGLTNSVYVTSNAETATQYLKAEAEFADRSQFPFPSVVMLDFHLPGMDGFEFLKWLRAQPEFQSLHIVILTGSVRVSTYRDFYACGADSFLRKPCRSEELRNLAQGFPQHWLTAEAPPPP